MYRKGTAYILLCPAAEHYVYYGSCVRRVCVPHGDIFCSPCSSDCRDDVGRVRREKATPKHARYYKLQSAWDSKHQCVTKRTHAKHHLPVRQSHHEILSATMSVEYGALGSKTISLPVFMISPRRIEVYAETKGCLGFRVDTHRCHTGL